MPLILCPVAKRVSLIKQKPVNSERNVKNNVPLSKAASVLLVYVHVRLLKYTELIFFTILWKLFAL